MTSCAKPADTVVLRHKRGTTLNMKLTWTDPDTNRDLTGIVASSTIRTIGDAEVAQLTCETLEDSTPGEAKFLISATAEESQTWTPLGDLRIDIRLTLDEWVTISPTVVFKLVRDETRRADS